MTITAYGTIQGLIGTRIKAQLETTLGYFVRYENLVPDGGIPSNAVWLDTQILFDPSRERITIGKARLTGEVAVQVHAPPNQGRGAAYTAAQAVLAAFELVDIAGPPLIRFEVGSITPNGIASGNYWTLNVAIPFITDEE